MKKFEFLEHTADVKFQAFGKSIEKVFENSALAMISTMTKQRIKKKIKKDLKVKGKDFESLMYNFLEEILFIMDTEAFVLGGIRKLKIDKKNFELRAELLGDSPKKYEFHLDVKAITYNEMFVREEKKNWIAQVVLDV